MKFAQTYKRALLWSVLTLLLASWTPPISAQSVSYLGSEQVQLDSAAKLSSSDVNTLATAPLTNLSP